MDSYTVYVTLFALHTHTIFRLSEINIRFVDHSDHEISEWKHKPHCGIEKEKGEYGRIFLSSCEEPVKTQHSISGTIMASKRAERSNSISDAYTTANSYATTCLLTFFILQLETVDNA